MAHDVFISHSAKDKTTADAVCAMLEADGIRCWIAPRDVVPGMEWGECIIEAIEETRVMVLVFTAEANASPQIRREVERAVNHGAAILPVRVENVMPGRALEYFIGNVHWLDALTPPLEAHLKNLAGTVKMLLGRMGARSPTVAAPATPEVPRAAAASPLGPVVTPSTSPPSMEATRDTTVASPRSRRRPMLPLFAGRGMEKRLEGILFVAYAILAVGLGFWGYAKVGSDFTSDYPVPFGLYRAYPLFHQGSAWMEAIRCLISSIGLIRFPDLFQPGRAPWQLVIAQVAVPGVALLAAVRLFLIFVRKNLHR